MDFLDALTVAIGTYRVFPDPVQILPLHSWVFFDEFIRDETLHETKFAGAEYNWDIEYKTGSTVNWRGYGAIRNPTLGQFNVAAGIKLICSDMEVAYGEKDMNYTKPSSDPKVIAGSMTRLIQRRRANVAMRYWEGHEAQAFGLPVLTGEAQKWHGVPYHIVPITGAQVTAGTASGAQQGQHADGFSTWCGIDLSDSTYAGLRNWNASWDSTAADAVDPGSTENRERLARMFLALNFQGPEDFVQVQQIAQYRRMRLCTDTHVYLKMGAAAQKQNDNLGSDLMTHMGVEFGKTAGGQVICNGIPVRRVEALDTADATNRGYNPLYCLNLNHWRLIKQDGRWRKRRPPASNAVNQPDAVVEYEDNEFTIAPVDPQKAGGVISYVAAA